MALSLEAGAAGLSPPVQEKYSKVEISEPLSSRVRRAGARVYDSLRISALDNFDLLQTEDEHTPEAQELADELLEIGAGMNQLWISPEQRPASMQFDDPEILTFDRGQKVEFIFLQPEKSASSPEESAEIFTEYDVPVAIIPGWGATHNPFEDSMTRLSEKGRGVLSASPMHRVEAEKNEDYPPAIMKKVEALLLSLDRKDIDQIDAVGHSEGGIVLAIAATLRPEKFRNLVFVNPAGMIGEDNPYRLAKDFTINFADQIMKSVSDKEMRRRMGTAIKDGARSVIADPIGSIKEVFEISATEIPDLLEKLKEDGHGIAVVHSTNDIALPIGRIQQVVGSGEGMTDGFAVIKGTHAEVYFEDKVTELIHTLLHNLEAKKRKRQKEM